MLIDFINYGSIMLVSKNDAQMSLSVFAFNLLEKKCKRLILSECRSK